MKFENVQECIIIIPSIPRAGMVVYVKQEKKISFLRVIDEQAPVVCRMSLLVCTIQVLYPQGPLFYGLLAALAFIVVLCFEFGRAFRRPAQ